MAILRGIKEMGPVLDGPKGGDGPKVKYKGGGPMSLKEGYSATTSTYLKNKGIFKDLGKRVNLYKDDRLPTDWTTIEKTFITIPYQVGLERIKHYKLENGNWNLVK